MLFVRAIAGPGPALLPPVKDEDADGDGNPEASGEGGGVPPVTIRWARITCAASHPPTPAAARC
ncbi:hypothetical protein EE612_012031 [Oryza sativa]|uniref:Uncharacterized protein n=1 Tax=Oryza rufipogon TaxID=4529 RepID=A0A0E0NGZ2_ORYRU|nr:hypothetical protein EE612_012031 [Oryza sativa]